MGEVPGRSAEGVRFSVWLLELAEFRRSISIISACRAHVAARARTLQAGSGIIAALEKVSNPNKRRLRDDLTVSHRQRLIEELRADPKLAAEYRIAAEEEGVRVYPGSRSKRRGK